MPEAVAPFVMYFALGLSIGAIATLMVCVRRFPLHPDCGRRHPIRFESMTAIDMLRAFCGKF